MMRSKWMNRMALAALATAALVTAACGGEGATEPGEEEEETRPATTIQSGRLDQGNAGEVVPGHRSPRPGTTLTGFTPEFAWTDVPGASGFQVQVSVDPSFPADATTDSGIVDDLSWTMPQEISAGKTYYWRTRALFPLGAVGGWSDYSPFSSPLRLTADTPPPPEADMSTPSEADTSTPSEGGANGTTGTPIALGDQGTVVASLAIWDAANDALLTKNGRSLEDVLRDLRKGRVYQFAATLDMVLYPRDFGIDRDPIQLTGGRQRLVFW